MSTARALVFGVVLVAVNAAITAVLLSHSQGGALPADTWRTVGSKLQGAGLSAQAAEHYARYLELPSDKGPEERAPIALSLGTLLMEEARYEQALGWLYLAEILAPGSDAARSAAPRIVECLERSGHRAAASLALKSRSSLSTREQPSDAGDPVVGKVGEIEVRRSEVLALYEAAPEGARSGYRSPEGKKALVDQALAARALYERARARGLADSPELKRRAELLGRQLAVADLIDEAAREQIRPSAQDLENYYHANKARFPQGGFEESRPQVEQAYVASRIGEIYASLAAESLSNKKVDYQVESLELPQLTARPSLSAPPSPAGEASTAATGAP